MFFYLYLKAFGMKNQGDLGSAFSHPLTSWPEKVIHHKNGTKLQPKVDLQKQIILKPS